MTSIVSPVSGERSQRQSDFSPSFRRDYGNSNDDDSTMGYFADLNQEPANAPGSPSAASVSRFRNSRGGGVNTNVNNNNNHHNNISTSPLSPLEQERQDESSKLNEIANEHLKSQAAIINSMLITQNSNSSPTRKQYLQLSSERRHFRVLVERVYQTFGGSSSARLALEMISKEALLAKYFTPSQGNLHQVEKLTRLRDLGNKINNSNMMMTLQQEVEELVIENSNDDKYQKFQTELNVVVENCTTLKNFVECTFDSGLSLTVSSSPRASGNGDLIFCTAQVCISWLNLIRQASVFAQDVYDYNMWNKIIIDKIRKNNNIVSQQQQQRSRSRQDNTSDRKSPSPNAAAASSRSFCYGGDSETNVLLVSPLYATELLDAVTVFDQKRAYIFEEARRRKLAIPGEYGESTIRGRAASQPRREESRSNNNNNSNNNHNSCNNISQQRKQQSHSPSCGQRNVNNNNNNNNTNIVDEQQERNSIHQQVVNSIRKGDRSTYHDNNINENSGAARVDPSVNLFSNSNNDINSMSSDNIASLAEEQNTTTRNNNNNAGTTTSVKKSVNVGAHDFGVAGDDRNNLDAQLVPGHERRVFDLENRGPGKVLEQAMSPQAVYHIHKNNNNNDEKPVGSNKSASNHDLVVDAKKNNNGNDDDGTSETLAVNGNDPAKPKRPFLSKGGGKNTNIKNNNKTAPAATAAAAATSTKQHNQNSDGDSQTTDASNKNNNNNVATDPSSSEPQQLKETAAAAAMALLTPRRQRFADDEAKYGVASPDAVRCVPLDLETRRRMHFFLDPTYNSIMTQVRHKHHPRYYDIAENGAILVVMPFYYFAAFFYFAMVLYCRPADGYDGLTSRILAMWSVVIILFGMYNPEGSITVNAKSIPRILERQRATGRVNQTLVQMHEAAKFCEFYSNRKETIENEKKIEETKQLIVGALVATGHARRVILPKHYADTHLIQMNERRFFGELAERQQQQQNNNDDQNWNNHGNNNNNNNNSIRGGAATTNNNNNNNNLRYGANQQIGGGARTTTNGGTPIHGMNNNNNNNSTNNNNNNNNNANRVVTSNNNRSNLPPLANPRQ